MTETLLELTDVRSGYDDVEVLHGVDLRVDKGEVVSVIGANGAGKTTLMSTITGIVRTGAGKVTFAGEQIQSLPAHKLAERGLVLVPEGRRLFPDLTVAENLLLGSYARTARAHRAQRLEEVYDLFPRLKERSSQEAHSLSGGEQQMCAIARGLMCGPKLIMLDEPSLGLAPIVVAQLFELLGTLKERGVTLMLVEQNVGDALGMADRGYVLERGNITMSASGAELLADERVQAAYLGV